MDRIRLEFEERKQTKAMEVDKRLAAVCEKIFQDNQHHKPLKTFKT